jgi:hypothetical protein
MSTQEKLNQALARIKEKDAIIERLRQENERLLGLWTQAADRAREAVK